MITKPYDKLDIYNGCLHEHGEKHEKLVYHNGKSFIGIKSKSHIENNKTANSTANQFIDFFQQQNFLHFVLCDLTANSKSCV